MADTVKISALTEISSGALDDNSVVPVVDGGVTYKLPISKLKTFVGDSFATDTELSNQISVVNSTISGLDTGDISEGSNLYYTDARVKSKLNTDNIISGSATAIRTFLNVEDGADVTDDNSVVAALVSATGISAGDKTTIKSNLEIGEGGTDLGGTGTVSSSAQISDFGTFVENSVTSSMTVLSASYAITASYAENAGGGGGNDYISNVSLSSTTLTFTGVGSAFNSTVDFAGSDVLTLGDGNYLDYNDWIITSESIYNQFLNISAGAVPNGTVSSSIQVLGGTDIISSSTQIAELGAGIISSSDQVDFSGLDSDDISEGIVNQYYSTTKVLSYINSLEVVSGSAASGTWSGLIGKPADLVSSSQQVDSFGFFSDSDQLIFSQSLEQRFLGLDGVSNSEVNIFSEEQRFESGIKVTGSVEVQPGVGYFSGSGAGLTNIPQSAIVGGVGGGGNQIDEGNNLVSVSSTLGVRLQAYTGSVEAYASGGFNLNMGVFSGSGANLHSIPPEAIVGGVGGSGFADKILSGSASASITLGGVFSVNTGSFFDGNMTVSGSIIADEISVGTTGTPTLFSATNLNLSASNAVVVTDSPLRLSPKTSASIATFVPSTGDIVFNETDNEFQGYRNGTWITLNFTGSDVDNAPVDLGGTNVISSSQQIAELGGNIVSSSQQIVSERDIQNTQILVVENGEITGSTSLAYNIGTDTLTVGSVESTDVTYTGTLSGPAGSTGSFSRLLGDSLRINNALEFPSGDGLTNQVLKTDGAGNIDFVTVETLITSQDITTTGTITVGTGSVIGTGSISLEDNLTVTGTINGQEIGTGNVVLESNNIRLQSGGQLMLSSSNADLGVVIDDVLVLAERDSLPTTPRTGSIIVSGSSSGPRPYFFDGTAWTQMFA